MIIYKKGLKEHLNGEVECRHDLSMSDLTTYGLGGRIMNCYFPKTPFQAKKLYSLISAMGEKAIVIGNGSDILAADSEIKRPVICLKKMRGIIRHGEDKIYCLAGTRISEILSYCKIHNLGGLEYMYGIPATIGGAAFMNAGIAKNYISNNIVSVDYFGDFKGKINKNRCNFSFKHSIMRDINGIILGVTLKLSASDRDKIESEISRFKARRAHLPSGRSCGCVFLNGCDYSAGELIDKAGLKGLSHGGAYISSKHANFIINGGGSSADVKELIDIVKSRVFSCFGVELKEEVVYIGDF